MLTEAELLDIESAVSRMKAELDVGEKCKLLLACVRQLRSKVTAAPPPTADQARIAFDFIRHVDALADDGTEPTKPMEAAYGKAVAVIDRFLS